MQGEVDIDIGRMAAVWGVARDRDTRTPFARILPRSLYDRGGAWRHNPAYRMIGSISCGPLLRQLRPRDNGQSFMRSAGEGLKQRFQFRVRWRELRQARPASLALPE